ncbi:unnamed protein product [Brassica oleracea]
MVNFVSYEKLCIYLLNKMLIKYINKIVYLKKKYQCF